MGVITSMKNISKHWITHNSLIFTTEPFGFAVNDSVSYRSFKFVLFYNWILHYKLKTSILITSVDLFYYRLISVLSNTLWMRMSKYDIIRKDGYSGEDYYM